MKVTSTQLKRANQLSEEISELESFIYTADRCWGGELDTRKKRLFFSNKPYGIFEKKTLECNTKLKNMIRDLIYQYKQELENELESL